MAYYSDDEGLLDRIRELCEQDATDEDLLESIVQAFKEAPEDSALGKLLLEQADINLQAALDAQARNIEKEIEAQVEAEYETEFQRVEREYETQATYDLIEKRFLSEPRFRDRVLNRIRSDLSESRKLCEVPPLFERALATCDQDTVVSLLLEGHASELIERFRPELIHRLLEDHGREMREEIKLQLSKDMAYMKSLKDELLDQVAHRLFDEC